MPSANHTRRKSSITFLLFAAAATMVSAAPVCDGPAGSAVCAPCDASDAACPSTGVPESPFYGVGCYAEVNDNYPIGGFGSADSLKSCLASCAGFRYAMFYKEGDECVCYDEQTFSSAEKCSPSEYAVFAQPPSEQANFHIQRKAVRVRSHRAMRDQKTLNALCPPGYEACNASDRKRDFECLAVAADACPFGEFDLNSKK